MPFVTTDDGAQIFYRDWGVEGSPVLLSHGWPVHADAWEATALFLAGHGYRVIAHDRRGQGRSSQTWNGNEMDSYADDLATLIDVLDLRGLTLVGHSTGGGEIVRYLGRHGTRRVVKLVLIGVGPLREPRLLQAREASDRSHLYRELADGPFFGHGRDQVVSQGVRDAFWLHAMSGGHRGAYEGIAAFTAGEFARDLAAVDIPTLIIHGGDDQIVPLAGGGHRTAELITGAVLKVYEGRPHGLLHTDRDRLHADLLEFITH